MVYNNNGGTSIGGLDDGQTYYVISVDDTHIQLAQSLDDAISGNAITLTSPGTGSFTLPAPTSNVMAYINSSTVTAGGQVLVRSGFDDPDLTAPTDPAPASTLTINPQTSVSLTDNAIHFSSPDGFKTGDQVVYHNGGGTSIGGLTDGQTYYAIVADPSTIKLASTYANAVAPIPVPIQLSSTGDGTSQTIAPLDETEGVAFNPTDTTVSHNQWLTTTTTLAFDPQASVSLTDNTIHFSSPDGLNTGDTVVYHNGGGTSIGGLTDGQTYYAIVVDLSTIELASTYANAVASTPVPTQLTSTGDSAGQISLGVPHGFTTGEEVVYHNGGGTNTDIQGLQDGQTYYVVVIDSETFELAATHADAVAQTPTVLAISAGMNPGTGHTFIPVGAGKAQTFGPTAVSTAQTGADEITFASDPGLQTGDAVVYHNGGGTSIGGLTDGQVYYAIRVDATHYQLALTATQANDGEYIYLTSAGTGTNHSLVKKLSSVNIDGIEVALPTAFGAQIVSVTAGGAGGGNVGGAGAVSLNFIRMNVQSYISDTGAGQVQAGGDVDVLANDTSATDSGSGSLALSLQGGTAVNASVGVNDISNTIAADIQGATVQSTGGSVTVAATETAQDVNAALGGAGDSSGKAFGGSFSVNYIGNTVTAGIQADGTGNSAVASTVTAAENVTVTATDTVSIASLAGNIQTSINKGADRPAAPSRSIMSTKRSMPPSTIRPRLRRLGTSTSRPRLPSRSICCPDWTCRSPRWRPRVAAQVIGVAGSVTLNWIENDVEATIADISAGDNINAGATLTVSASDHSTIDSLAGALAIAGIGAQAATGTLGASVAFNYLGGDPNHVNTTDNNTVTASIENCAGSIAAGQVLVEAVYGAQINNITVAGGAAGTYGLGGSVSVNIIRNNTTADIVNASNITTTTSSADGLDVTSEDTAEIWAFAGGVGIAIAKVTPDAVAAGVSVAYNEIVDSSYAHIDNSSVNAAGDVNLVATSEPTIKAYTIGVAISGSAGTGTAFGGAGAGSGNIVRDSAEAYITDCGTGVLGVSSDGAVSLIAADAPTIQASAGALGIGISTGEGGAGASVGISVAVNNIADTTEAYIHASTVKAAGNIVALAAEAATITALTMGGAVSGSTEGGGVAFAGAGAGSGNTIGNTVYAYIDGGSTVTTQNGIILQADDTAEITANAGGVALAGGFQGGAVAVSLGISVAINDIEDKVHAYIDDSTVTAGTGDIALSAAETAVIYALTIGGAVSESGGGAGFGVGLAARAPATRSAITSAPTFRTTVSSAPRATSP